MREPRTQRVDHLDTEHFDVVTFAHYRPRARWQGPHRGMLQRFGEPDWRRISRADVEQLIGQELGEPACTCRVAPGEVQP